VKRSAEPFLALQNTIVFGWPGKAARADAEGRRASTSVTIKSDTVRERLGINETSSETVLATDAA